MSSEELKRQLLTIKPDQLEAYLIASGWRRDGDLGNRASIWHRDEDYQRDAEVLLPISQTLKDYSERILDAVLAIGTLEKRTPLEVARSISGYLADHISIRVVHHDVAEGTIPLTDGVLLNQRARDLLASSAMSTQSKRKYFSGKRTPEVREFLDSLRLGQTEFGSYIVNIIAPVKPIQSDQQSMPMTSLTRMVTANLSSSLDALSHAISKFAETGDLAIFDEAVADGASANMCDALLGLSGEQRTRGFEITIKPSLSEEFRHEPQKFLFNVDTVRIIAAVSEYYRDNYVLRDRTISGFIKRLDRVATEENGTITIETTIVDTDKLVTIELGPIDYLDAVTAHKAKDVVECHGDIHVKARTVKLLNPSGFRVRRSGDLL